MFKITPEQFYFSDYMITHIITFAAEGHLKKYSELIEKESKKIMQQFTLVEFRKLAALDGEDFEEFFKPLYKKYDDLTFIASFENQEESSTF